MSAGMRIQDTHVFILVHSYRATSSLTLPQGGIHKKQCQSLTKPAVLEHYKNTTHNAEKPYFSTPCTPRNPIKEWLTLTPLQNRIKERLHLKRRCKNSKPVVQFAAELHQHLHQDQRFPRTSTLENLFGKPFKNLSILLLTWKMFDLCQRRNCSALLSSERDFSLYRKQFLTSFQKTVEKQLWKQQIHFWT